MNTSSMNRVFRITEAGNKKFPDIEGEDELARSKRYAKWYKENMMSQSTKDRVSKSKEKIKKTYDLNAYPYPKEHFDPDEWDLDPKDFKELSGDPRFAHSSIFRDDDGPNSLLYNPKHWKPVTDFETDKENEYFYRTDTGGKVALKALTPAAKKVLTDPNIRDMNKENLESHEARATRHKHGAN